MKKTFKLILKTISVILWLLLISGKTYAGYESVSHIVGKYNHYTDICCYLFNGVCQACVKEEPDPNNCTTSLPSLIEPYTMQEIWSYYLGQMNYNDIHDWADDDVQGKYWSDIDWFSWGLDTSHPRGTDWADVILYDGHGGACCNGVAGAEGAPFGCSAGNYFTAFSMGDQGGYPSSCWIRSDNVASNHGHMRFGYASWNESKDANFLVTFACNSAEYCAWQHSGWDDVTPGIMRLVLGWHGEYAGLQINSSLFVSYMIDSDDEYAALHWISYMYVPEYDGTYDNCPVAMTWGPTHNGIFYTIYQYEAFKNLKDNNWTNSLSEYYFVQGCTPWGEITSLPPTSPASR